MQKKFIIQIKRGLSEKLKEINPLLHQGEICLEIDTNKIKVGDGIRRYNDLPYLNKSIDYIEDFPPTTDVNPKFPYATWYDLSTKILYICIDNTPNENIWVSIDGKYIIRPYIDTVAKKDIFNDESCIYLFNFDETLSDIENENISFNLAEGNLQYVESIDNIRFKKALYFDGNTYFTLPKETILENNKFGSGILTLSFKVKFPKRENINTSENYCLIHFSKDDENTFSFWINEKSTQKPCLIVNDNIYTLSEDLQDGNWHHIVIDTKGNVWIDKNQVYKDKWNINILEINKDILLGADRDPNSVNDYVANGTVIDQLRFFNRVLTQEEVEYLDNELVPKGYSPNETNTVENELEKSIQNLVVYVKSPDLNKWDDLHLDIVSDNLPYDKIQIATNKEISIPYYTLDINENGSKKQTWIKVSIPKNEKIKLKVYKNSSKIYNPTDVFNYFVDFREGIENENVSNFLSNMQLFNATSNEIYYDNNLKLLVIDAKNKGHNLCYIPIQNLPIKPLILTLIKPLKVCDAFVNYVSAINEYTFCCPEQQASTKGYDFGYWGWNNTKHHLRTLDLGQFLVDDYGTYDNFYPYEENKEYIVGGGYDNQNVYHLFPIDVENWNFQNVDNFLEFDHYREDLTYKDVSWKNIGFGAWDCSKFGIEWFAILNFIAPDYVFIDLVEETDEYDLYEIYNTKYDENLINIQIPLPKIYENGTVEIKQLIDTEILDFLVRVIPKEKINDENPKIYLKAQIPHSAKINSEIHLHMHTYINEEIANNETKYVKFKVKVIKFPVNSPQSDYIEFIKTFPIYSSDYGLHKTFNFGNIGTITNISDVFLITIERLVDDPLDTYGNLPILYIDIHFFKDSIGSTYEWIK